MLMLLTSSSKLVVFVAGWGCIFMTRLTMMRIIFKTVVHLKYGLLVFAICYLKE